MCGLVGFYPKKNKKVDLSKLYNLWIINEDRGTHSCGISYGPIRQVGINTTSKVRDFIPTIHDDIVNTDLTNMPIICHTRHATAGSHTADNAHPFRWHRKTEDNFFSFAHNGVIRDLYSYKKLLGMERHIENLMTIDSQVLGLAMYDSFVNILTEEEILTQYDGNAAFICYDVNDTFKVWKGANNNVEERPLYYHETKDGWYFCSIDTALLVNFLVEPILVKNNTLLTFKNHKLENETVYTRNIKSFVATNVANCNSSAATCFNKTISQLIEPSKNTGLGIINNAMKLTLNSILGAKNNTTYHINILDNSNFFPGKYCYNATEKAINGTFNIYKINDKFRPFFGGGENLIFDNGVLVKKKDSYTILQKSFLDLYTKNNTIENIYNIMHELVYDDIVDFMPFYDKVGKLIMMFYKEDDKVDYISTNDRTNLMLPSCLNIEVDAYCDSKGIFLNSYI